MEEPCPLWTPLVVAKSVEDLGECFLSNGPMVGLLCPILLCGPSIPMASGKGIDV